MRNAILKKFLIIILLALGMSGIVSCVLTSRITSEAVGDNMEAMLRIADYSLDYSGDLSKQAALLKEEVLGDELRFMIIGRDGTVAADTSDEAGGFDFKESGNPFAASHDVLRFFGKSRGLSAFYVSMESKYGDYTLRLSAPCLSPYQYLKIFLPSFIFSFLTALIVSILFSIGFSNSITRPLEEISAEILKLEHRNPELKFGSYQYEELNTIADATTRMSVTVNRTVERLEQEKNIRQEFFSNVSHELKTPITSIQGYAELLEADMVPNEEMQKDFMKRIKKETRNMTGLINDILMISRLETKQAEVIKTQVRIVPVLDEVLESLAPMAAELQVYIKTDCRPLTVAADPKHIQQLLANLLGNAIKYNNPGGTVEILITAMGEDFILVVKDNGMGIPKESVARVFERFYRVDKGRSKKIGGTGLGLAIVKHIVQYYQGSIDLKSEIDVGTEIRVRLPIRSDTV